MFKKVIFIFTAFLFANTTVAQKNIDELTQNFELLAVHNEGLNESLKIDISGLTLHDFISSIAENHRLNVDVDTNLNQLVSNNFFDVKVKDVLVHLADKYNLDVIIRNNIITFNKIVEKTVVQVKPLKNIDITYNSQNDFLSVKLEKDTLSAVINKMVEITGKNLLVAPTVRNMPVSSYIVNRPFNDVIQMFSKANDLLATLDDKGVYYIEKNYSDAASDQLASGTNSRPKQAKVAIGVPGYYDVTADKNGQLSMKAYAADLADLITETAEKLKLNYFFYNRPENEKVTLSVENVTFEDLLKQILEGKKYTFKKEGNYYLIGEQSTEGLRVTELIQLDNRSIELVLTSLPQVFSEKLEIKEFLELNGLVVSGSKNVVEELKTYIKQIDKIVPMVQIEVIIVQYNKSYSMQTGLQVGYGYDAASKVVTGGKIFPNSDAKEVQLNGSSINKLIDAFNGFGLFKLGKVSEAFYANLKFLENNSIINVESTPKIATLSGHDARLSIGETSYYFEQTNRLINNNIGNDVLNSGVWKSTDANLSLSIKPFVSKDENVTLTITVEKSSFLDRAGEGAPPDKATQKFESLVRVKNNEMILLGGLDEVRKEDTGTGTPLLSRIPIIKWLFSGRQKGKNSSKLHLFIKPTLVY